MILPAHSNNKQNPSTNTIIKALDTYVSNYLTLNNYCCRLDIIESKLSYLINLNLLLDQVENHLNRLDQMLNQNVINFDNISNLESVILASVRPEWS